MMLPITWPQRPLVLFFPQVVPVKPVQRSGTMTRQHPGPLSKPDTAIFVPPPDPARSAPVVSCRQPWPQVTHAAGRPHGRPRQPVTTRVDLCRPAVTVSTIVVSTPRRSIPAGVLPGLPRAANSCRVHNIRGMPGAGVPLASDVLS